MLLHIPAYRKTLEENKETVLKEVEDHLMRYDRMKEFYKFLPDRGLITEDILNEAKSYKTMGSNVNEQGRFCGAIFAAEHEDTSLQKLLKDVKFLFYLKYLKKIFRFLNYTATRMQVF